jgi:hypothetical protein
VIDFPVVWHSYFVQLVARNRRFLTHSTWCIRLDRKIPGLAWHFELGQPGLRSLPKSPCRQPLRYSIDSTNELACCSHFDEEVSGWIRPFLLELASFGISFVLMCDYFECFTLSVYFVGYGKRFELFLRFSRWLLYFGEGLTCFLLRSKLSPSLNCLPGTAFVAFHQLLLPILYFHRRIVWKKQVWTSDPCWRSSFQLVLA